MTQVDHLCEEAKVMRHVDKVTRYEFFKRQIQRLKLQPVEYEEAIKKLCDAIGC